MEILDLDSSAIIGTGTLQRPGYLTRVTPEVAIEISNHGQYTQTGTFLVAGKSPSWHNFTLVSQNSTVSVYSFETKFETFCIQNIVPGKSSFTSLCGNYNHSAQVVIFSPNAKQYGLCSALAKENSGDFSMVKNYVFNPNDFLYYEARDICLGKTLKKIVEMRS